MNLPFLLFFGLLHQICTYLGEICTSLWWPPDKIAQVFRIEKLPFFILLFGGGPGLNAFGYPSFVSSSVVHALPVYPYMSAMARHKCYMGIDVQLNHNSRMVFTLPLHSPTPPFPLTWPPLRLYVRESGKQHFPVSSLVSLQSEGNYSWLCWADGQRMLMPRTLKWYMDQLPPAHFIRFHRNCIINRHYIQRLENSKAGPIAHLSTGETLAISRRRWRGVCRELRLIREAEPTPTHCW